MSVIGYQWLSHCYDCRAVQPFAIRSEIGRSRSTRESAETTLEIYPASYRPDATLSGHLTFALRYEGVHLEFLSRLFAKPQVSTELESWIQQEPTGAYARRAGFFYEWLTGEILNVSDLKQGNYIDALNPADFLTGIPVKHPRWRIRDNLPGNRDFCPVVRRTAAVQAAERYDLEGELRSLESDFGIDLLRRSTVWIGMRESRASFQIEHETHQEDRIQRFARVMETQCGKYDNPFEIKHLEQLQHDILGENALRYGVRCSPIYVGHTSHYQPVVDYIAPHWSQLLSMLEGLSCHLQRTAGVSSIVRAATAAFGFVYIHPMTDGNGRISRFLINDVLRRDGLLPVPLVLPVSVAIAQNSRSRADYDRILETFSRPLMQHFAGRYCFANTIVAADGTHYNFHFDGYDDALPTWRYPDLTQHVIYLARILDDTIRQQMRAEAIFLRANDQARQAIKEIIEMPDPDIDRIIRSVRENDGQLSNKLLKLYPLLDQRDELAQQIATVIQEAFK